MNIIYWGDLVIHKTSVYITADWDVVSVRQIGRKESKEIGFNTVDQVRITTAISELARNIYLYAKVGTIEIERLDSDGMKGIAVVAVDKGPGIENLRKVMEEGYSTSGGLGDGLPGVKRLMDTFHIQSIVGEGTVIRAEKWLR